MAIGYGTQKKVNLTGSVAAASIETVDKLAVPTLNVALQGLAPGLVVFDGGHQPGHEQVNMLIRGRTTIDRLDGNIARSSSSSPLVLVDGVEADIVNVDIDDVASVSVLKDASSAAIYGSRAANGVILVTTKRGQARDKLSITYNGVRRDAGHHDVPAAGEHGRSHAADQPGLRQCVQREPHLPTRASRVWVAASSTRRVSSIPR